MGEARVGLIGYGHGGAVFHAPLVRATDGMVLAAIVTSDSGRRARAGREHPSARILPDAESLWQQAADLDLVIVSSPNRTHVPLGMAALGHGLPVVIDKPMAATVQDARSLVEEAERRALLLTVFQNRRWDGDFLTVRRLLAEHRLGDVFRFESRFERWRPTPRSGWRERGDPHEAGGLLYDLGSHLIDQALVLFGPVTHVYAELDKRRAGVEVDDDAFVALTHASGVRSHLWMTALAAQTGPRLRVLGTTAAYVKHGLDLQEDALNEGADPADPAFGQDPVDRWGTISSGAVVHTIQTEAGVYRHFYRAVLSALRNRTAPPVDPRDAVRTLGIVEAARRFASATAPSAL
ncbi:MAG: Gfo/Idh/MocA family oxidoreductase [Vicinamibacterales bacterium]